MKNNFLIKIKMSKHYKYIIDCFYIVSLAFSILYLFLFNKLIIIKGIEEFIADLLKLDFLRTPIFYVGFLIVGFMFYQCFVCCQMGLVHFNKTKNKLIVKKSKKISIKFINAFLGPNKTRQLLI